MLKRYAAVPLLLLLSGCGSQVLIQGEPNFNTAILLPYPMPEYQIAVSARNAQNLGLVPAYLPSECPMPPLASTTDTVSSTSTISTQTSQTTQASTTTAPQTTMSTTSQKTTAQPAHTATPTAPKPDVIACVYSVKAIIDDLYREYRITLHHYADNGNAVADIGVLGLTTAATGPIGSSLKTILSGTATLVGGSKSILNQDLLYQKAIEDIINQMDIDRYTQFNTIMEQMKTTYTLEQAKADLLEYFADGTWDHAIVSLQATVAAKKANCKAQTDTNKVSLAQSGAAMSDNTTSSPAPTPATPPAGGTPAKPAGTSTTPATTTNPAPTTNDCGPTTSTQAPTLTVQAAQAGKIFPVSAGAGYYKIKTAAASSTDFIYVIYSADGKSFTGAAMKVPFSTFAGWVKPTPVTP